MSYRYIGAKHKFNKMRNAIWQESNLLDVSKKEKKKTLLVKRPNADITKGFGKHIDKDVHIYINQPAIMSTEQAATSLTGNHVNVAMMTSGGKDST